MPQTARAMPPIISTRRESFIAALPKSIATPKMRRALRCSARRRSTSRAEQVSPASRRNPPCRRPPSRTVLPKTRTPATPANPAATPLPSAASKPRANSHKAEKMPARSPAIQIQWRARARQCSPPSRPAALHTRGARHRPPLQYLRQPQRSFAKGARNRELRVYKGPQPHSTRRAKIPEAPAPALPRTTLGQQRCGLPATGQRLAPIPPAASASIDQANTRQLPQEPVARRNPPRYSPTQSSGSGCKPAPRSGSEKLQPATTTRQQEKPKLSSSSRSPQIPPKAVPAPATAPDTQNRSCGRACPPSSRDSPEIRPRSGSWQAPLRDGPPTQPAPPPQAPPQPASRFGAA